MKIRYLFLAILLAGMGLATTLTSNQVAIAAIRSAPSVSVVNALETCGAEVARPPTHGTRTELMEVLQAQLGLDSGNDGYLVDRSGPPARGADSHSLSSRRAAMPNAGWEEVGAGSASGGGVSDNDENSYTLSPAIGPDGVPYVAWNDYSGGGDDEIYVRRWNGSTWEEVGAGSASGGGVSDNDENSYTLSPAIGPDGVPYVAWYDDSGGGDAEIYVRRWQGGDSRIDLTISTVEPLQVLEGQPLVVGKDTAVKVIVSKTGEESADNVQVKLTIGAEEANSFYVSEPGNWDSEFRLQQDNADHPLSFSDSEITKTIYFFGDGLAPEGAGSYAVTVEVDPSNTIPETEEGNNLTETSAELTAYHATWGHPIDPALRLRYVPVEQLRSQTVADFEASQTDLIRATYPVAGGSLQSDLGALPYIRSIQARIPFTIGLKIAFLELYFAGKVWSLDLTTDVVVGIVPAGWLRDSYPELFNDELDASWYGVSAGPSVHSVFVELGDDPRRTAHEVGHTFGLWDKYSGPPADYPVIGGLYTSELRVMNDGDTLGEVRHGVYSIMTYASYERPGYDLFVDASDYRTLAAHGGHSEQALARSSPDEGIVLVAGTIGKDGSADLMDWYRLPGGTPDAMAPGPYSVRSLDSEGAVLHEESFTMTFTLMGATTIPLDPAPFAFAIPFISGTNEYQLANGAETLITRTVSAHSPSVTVLSPNGGEVFTESISLEWTASDADEDTLRYAVLLSQDSGISWSTVSIGLTTTMHILDAYALPPSSENLVKVIATDGVQTGQDVSDTAFTVMGKVFLPVVVRS